MKRPIDTQILEALQDGPVSKEALQAQVMKQARCTRQGYFKALRGLRADESVTVHGSALSLSYLWIQKQAERLRTVEQAYHVPAYQAYFGALQEGQTNTYSFRTLNELELFWTHIIIALVENTLSNESIIAITPHDWFELLRPHTSDLWDKRFSHIPHCVINTHATAKEKQYALHQKVKHLERMFNVNPLKQSEATYINIIGDYVFEATFDPKAVTYIRKAMSSGTCELPEACLNEKGKYKLKVQRNTKKATSIKKKIAKYFTYKLL